MTTTLRQTKTKALVTKVFQTYHRPLRLSEVTRLVKISLPQTSFSTVFRIATKLLQEGTIRQIDWRERGSRYEWAALDHHHHLVCELCGQVIDISDEDLGFSDQSIEKKTGFILKHHLIELEGICPDCQQK